MTAPTRPPAPRALRPGHRVVIDCGLAACYGLIIGAVATHPARSGVASLGAGSLGVVAIVLGRRLPLVALGLLATGCWLSSAFRPAAGTLAMLAAVPMLFLLFSSALRGGRVVVAGSLLLALAGAAGTAQPRPGLRGGVLVYALLFCTAWAVGLAVGRQRRYDRELVRYHALLGEVEADRARRAAARERMRIARELHDVVAHSMSVITVQAALGELVIAERPAEAGAALGVIQRTGREALADLRRLLKVLRSDETDDGAVAVSPMPGLADLDGLVARTAQAGVRVEVRVEGPIRTLAPGVDLSAYRIIQEALTNVVRHAGTDVARVVVRYGRDDVAVEVIDEGVGAAAAGNPAGGLGLAGMRERAAVYGGECSAQPLPGRGFRVVARLPLSAGGGA
ncbi:MULTISPECIES: sensor histidine kinase [unclassified Actinoplanes]|uniref:sensor histidine kinase n=1 Tax=unclassified Actinoplanes TaxID=2626549 RepID=UPI0005B788B5|nr:MULTISPECIES: histidine kinase [unclassified Actinoplanes]